MFTIKWYSIFRRIRETHNNCYYLFLNMNFFKIYNNLILDIKNNSNDNEIDSKYCNLNTFDKYEKERKYTKIIKFCIL